MFKLQLRLFPMIFLFAANSLLADDFTIDKFQIQDFQRESYFLTITAKDKETLKRITREETVSEFFKKEYNIDWKHDPNIVRRWEGEGTLGCLKLLNFFRENYNSNLEQEDCKKIQEELTENKNDFTGLIKIDSNFAKPVDKSVVISEKTPVVKLLFTPSVKLTGTVKLEILDRNTRTTLATAEYTIPERNSARGKQPFIQRTSPKGGTGGDTISLYGTNLGENVDDLYIKFVSPKPDPSEPFDEHRYEIERPFFLAPTGDVATNSNLPIDIVKFTIPTKLMEHLNDEFNFLERWIFGKEIHFYLYVNNRPSSTHSLRILPRHWKWVNMSLSFLITCLFVLIIGLLAKTIHFFDLILIDPQTNSYKLANFQAFAWTLVTFACYFFVTCTKLILLRDGELPSLNTSLIALLGISYTGMISAGYLENKKPENRLKSSPPRFFDLISREDGSIDMSKLQLFGFTLLGIIVYIANLFMADTLLGLPEIPGTYLSLMIGSQTSYVTAKYVGDTLSVNSVEPESVAANSENVEFTLIGSGFTEGMKVYFKGMEPISATLKEKTILSFVHPKIPEGQTTINPTLVPREGANIDLGGIIKII